MSIEEKAQAYDEALERARKQRDEYQKEFDKTDNNSRLASILRAAISAVEMAFPELAESEDERMLREIKRYIKEQGDKPTGLPNGTVAVSDMIAWLEKQSEEKFDLIDRNFRRGREVGYQEGVADTIAKQKEQKHTLKFKVGNKVHLEGDDVNILTITGIEKDRYLTDYAYGPILFEAEDIWQIVEQKPAEWRPSDEQIKAMGYFVRKHQATANHATTTWPEFEAFKSLYQDLKKL